jgi:hypothetical protein
MIWGEDQIPFLGEALSNAVITASVLHHAMAKYNSTFRRCARPMMDGNFNRVFRWECNNCGHALMVAQRNLAKKQSTKLESKRIPNMKSE